MFFEYSLFSRFGLFVQVGQRSTLRDDLITPTLPTKSLAQRSVLLEGMCSHSRPQLRTPLVENNVHEKHPANSKVVHTCAKHTTPTISNIIYNIIKKLVHWQHAALKSNKMTFLTESRIVHN